MSLESRGSTSSGSGPKSKSRGKAQGPDGRWMLKLIYPHAMSLEMYLERWLRDMVMTAPGSPVASAIETCGGPLTYLVRQEDGPEFKQVPAVGMRC